MKPPAVEFTHETAAPPAKSPPGISFVICCYNSALRLPPTLAHLTALEVPPDLDWEVLVIDNGSTDETAKVARAAWPDNAPAPLRIVQELRPGQTFARVTGLREARYEIVSFIDDDNWVARDWLKKVRDIMDSHPEVAALGGLNIPVADVTLPSWFESQQHSYAVGPQSSISGDITEEKGKLCGAGLSVRKSAYERMHALGFSFVLTGRNRDKLGASEDYELCYALALAGWRLWYDPTLQLRHYLPEHRLEFSYLRRLSRSISRTGVFLDPYLFALGRRDGQSIHPVARNWLTKVAVSTARLVRYSLTYVFCFEKARRLELLLIVDCLVGRLAGLLLMRQAYVQHVQTVKHALWRESAPLDTASPKLNGATLPVEGLATATPPGAGRRLLGGMMWATTGKVFTALSALLTNALLARLLAPAEMGSYFLVFSIVFLGTMLGSLGLHQSLVRFIAENLTDAAKLRATVRKLMELGVVAACGTALIYWPFGGWLAHTLFHAPQLAQLSGLIAAWILASTLQALMAEAFRGFNEIRAATIFSGLLSGGLQLAVLFVCRIAHVQLGLEEVVAIGIVSCVTSAVVSAGALFKKIRSLSPQVVPSPVSVREMWSASWPMLLTSFTLYVLTQADIWILSALHPPDEVALYGAASRLAVLMMFSNSILFSVLPPVIAARQKQGQFRELERILRAGAGAATAIALPLFLIFTIFAPQILALIYGAKYRAGAPMLGLLGFGLFVNVFTGIRGYVLTYAGEARCQLMICIGGAGLNVVLCYIGARWFGAVGVAAAAMTAMIAQCLTEMIMVRRIFHIRTHASFHHLASSVIGLLSQSPLTASFMPNFFRKPENPTMNTTTQQPSASTGDSFGNFLRRTQRFFGKSKLISLWLRTRRRGDLRTATLPGGGAVQCDVGIPYEAMVWLDSEEHEDLEILQSLLPAGSTFADCGANIGLWSIVAASTVGPTGKVFSFEPNPGTFQKLTQNIQRNGFDQIVQPRCTAVGEEVSTVSLVCEQGHNNSHIVEGRQTAGSVEVPVQRLDDMLDSVTVHGIKIDVEGYELHVVKGGAALLRRCKPWLCIEFNTELSGVTKVGDWSVYQFLRSLGYSAYLFTDAKNSQATPLSPEWSTDGYLNLLFRFA